MTGRRSGRRPILRAALAYAGALGLPIVDHAEEPALTEGAEANDGFVATVLGLRGWPVAAEEAAVARDLAVLADVVRDVPGARLHLTHLSTAGALDLVRRAKAAGLPVTCDVTPHHLALTDEWVAGAATLGLGGGRRPMGATAPSSRPPFASSLRVNPPLRAPDDAAACLAALLDGTADAVATDHAPHTEVDKAVEFGLAANGISGLETALGVLLAAVDAGRLPLARAIEALTTGPARVLGGRSRRGRDGRAGRGRSGRSGGLRSRRRWTVTARHAPVARQEHAAARHGSSRGPCWSRSPPAGSRTRRPRPDARSASRLAAEPAVRAMIVSGLDTRPALRKPYGTPSRPGPAMGGCSPQPALATMRRWPATR